MPSAGAAAAASTNSGEHEPTTEMAWLEKLAAQRQRLAACDAAISTARPVGAEPPSAPTMQPSPPMVRTFAPALIIWPIWAYTVFSQGLAAEIFSQYWSMSVAMVLGSFVAGSTPLGGGVVAYPVSQLVLHWPTPDSRDASILVQSIGMNAAAYLLLLRKPHLLDAQLIQSFTLWGSLGVLLGLSVASPADVDPTVWAEGTLPPGLANIVFGTLILCFAIIYFYVSELRPAIQGTVGVIAPIGHSADDAGASDEDSLGARHWTLLQALRVGFAVSGGFLTANVGSGSDMCLYVFGVFVWNPLRPKRALSETALTASSVVVMGLLSTVTSVCRALNGGYERRILLCWGADSFVVVLGAPIGALVLTPRATAVLRRLFYVMAVVQVITRFPSIATGVLLEDCRKPPCSCSKTKRCTCGRAHLVRQLHLHGGGLLR